MPSRSASTVQHRWWGLGAITLCVLIVGLDSYVLFTALPTLAVKLNANTTQLQWVSAAYTMAWACVLLPAGRMGDRYGRKRILLVGLAIFGIGSIVASQAGSANELIAMRALMGLGAAVIMPLTLSIVPTMFDGASRTRAVAITTVGAMISLPAGPLLAGYLLKYFSWGSVFLINVPITLLAMLGIWLAVPESRDSTLRALDWKGSLFSMVGIVAIVYGAIEGPSWGWGSASVLALLIGGALLLALFAYSQLHLRNPLIDLRILKNRAFTLAMLASTAVSFGLSGMLFLVSPFLQIIQANDAQGTGLRLLPTIAGVVVGGASSDVLVKKIGPKVTMLIGLFITGAGQIVLSRVHADSSYTFLAIALAIFGVGQGLTFPTSMDTLIAVLPKDITGSGSGLARAVQSLGATLGVAILGSVLNGVYAHHLAASTNALPSAMRSAAQSSIAGAATVAQRLAGGAGDSLFHAAARAYASGVGTALIVSTAVLWATAALMLVFMPRRVDVPAETEAPASPQATVGAVETL